MNNRRLELNLRLYPWFLVFTWEGFGHAVWYLYLFSYKGLSLEQMAWLVLAGDGVIVLAEVPTGWLADRIGRRTSMAIGCILQMASMALFVVGDSFLIFWLAMAVCGLGDTFRNGADQALVYDSCLALRARERFRPLLGRALLTATVAMIAAQLTGGALASAGYWELPFVIEIFVSLVGLILVWRMVEPPRTKEELPEAEPLSATTGAAASIGVGHPSMIPAPPRRFTQSNGLSGVVALLLFSALLMVPPELSGFHLPSELNTAIALSPLGLAVLYSFFELLSGLGSHLGGNPRWRALPALAGLAALIGAATLAFAARVPAGVAGLWLYLLARAALDFAAGMAGPLLSDELNRRVSSRVRATALSWLNTAVRVLPLALLPLSAELVVQQGYVWMYLAFGVGISAALLAAGWWLTVVGRTPRPSSY